MYVRLKRNININNNNKKYLVLKSKWNEVLI